MNILITGGSKGIGKATALKFACEGNKVFINYYHDDHAAVQTFNEVKEAGATPYLLKYNIGEYDQVEEMAEVIKKKVDTIDVIVHCAAGIIRGDILEIPPTKWKDAVQVSSLSLIYITRELRNLLKYGSSIIALSSLGARKAVEKYAALGATKAFTESLIRYLAGELAPLGIRANIVSPGPIDTEAYRSMFPNAEERLATAAKRNPSGRNLTFDDITNTISFLASPESQMIQGEIIRIDGGLSLI